MCLITAIPKGKVKYSKDLEGFIKEGMSSNTDGSGFMYKRDGENVVNIDKGYRSPESILKAIRDLDLQIKDELVIHHRIGTSGAKNEINMHPFVVSDNALVLQTIKGAVNLPVMAHNGVFSEYSDYQSPYSDTYHFVNQFMSIPEITSLVKRDTKTYQKIFGRLMSYNKLAFLFPDRDMILIGNFTEDDGNYHSNGGYKTFVYDRGCSSDKDSKNTGLVCRHNSRYFQDNDTESDDDDYPSREATATAKVISQVISKRVVENNLVFDAELINVTKDNYKHFIIIAIDNWNKGMITKGKAYTFEHFHEDTIYNYIVTFDEDKIMHSINYNNHKQNFRIYIRAEFVEFYKGLFNLVKEINGTPSKTMLKKIGKVIERRKNQHSFKYKDYGYVKFKDLKYLYEKYVNDDFKEIKETLGVANGFSMNEVMS